MLGRHSRERSAMQSREILGGGEHRRSDSGGMLMQPRESEDWKIEGRRQSIPGLESRRDSIEEDGARTSGVGLGRTIEGGMRRRSVGRNAGDEVRISLGGDRQGESPTSPDSGNGNGAKSGHRRSASASGQTRFQELVHGPSHPNSGSTRDRHRRSQSGTFAHRRSISGRTSSEVERQLDITPTQSRRVPSGSSGSSVGRVVSWMKAARGKEIRSEKRDSAVERETEASNGQWSTDGLAEWFYARSQSSVAVCTLIPRAGISAAALFSFWDTQAVGGVAGGGPGGRDGAFFRANGTLTGFARGVLVANVAWVVARALLVLVSM
jgi:hypothetical protein